jgi:hypothetical protein
MTLGVDLLDETVAIHILITSPLRIVGGFFYAFIFASSGVVRLTRLVWIQEIGGSNPSY